MKSSTSRNLIVLGLQLVFLLHANFSSAQDLDNITISGRVVDQTGAVIPGAVMLVVLGQTGASHSTVTDSNGRYRLIQLRPGNYKLRVSQAGFSPQEKKNLSTLSGQNIQLDFTLLPQNVISEPIVISSDEGVVVDTTRTVVGGTIPSHELESLPILNRSPLDLMFTVPGVSEEPLSTRDLAEDRNTNPANTPEEAGAFSLAGAPAYSNNLTIEGLDNNDDRAARERFQPPIDAVEELQVITNQFSAEYGRASGGRVNIRTRSGSTEFRGRVFYFFRDEALNANTFKNNSLGLPRLPLQEHDLGFTLGGPLLLPGKRFSDKTFFFSAYEYGRVLDSALVDTLVPVQQNESFSLPQPTSLQSRRLEDANSPALATEVAPFVSSLSTPLRTKTFTTRVDQQFSQVHTGSLLYSLGRLNNLRQFGGGNRLAEALQGKARDSEAISYSDTYVFSPTLINQTRLQYSQLTPSIRARGIKPVVLITIKDSLAPDDPAGRSGTLVAGSSTSGATDRSEERIQVQEILAKILGTHSLKFGFDAQRIRSTFIDLSDASGTFNFASAGDFLAGIPSRFRQNFQTSSTQRNAYLGFFVQDEWRLTPNLMVSYGLRYERESIIRDVNNFGPRFSVAWDPFKTGKTVLRFGVGAFYNRVLLRTIDDFTLGTQQRFFDTNTLRDPSSGTLLSADQRRAFINTHLKFPEVLQLGSPLVQTFGVFNTGFSRRLDPALRIPESYQTNVGAERDLGHGFALESNFTVSRGLHLWREFNANAPVLPAGYENFSEYLASRDFPNFRRNANGVRPLYNASSAGELVRFVLNPPSQSNSNPVGNIIEFGVPVSLVNLNSLTSTTSVDVALAALNHLRPDPSRAEIEQLISAGNSFYEGLTVELRRRFNATEHGFGFLFRSAYTFSHLTDDGVVNTSDALAPGDFRHERARSLMDRRHRFVFSGTFDLPSYLGKLQLAPIWRITSGGPFNISIGGTDRNLDDVGNDRPSFNGDTRLLHWRRPDRSEPTIANLFALPTIGQSGNLPRNAGQGPGQFLLDLNVARNFALSDRIRLHAVMEFDNVLNKTGFSFGSEFINFSSIAPTASQEQRQAFLDSFLVATRTLRPRQIRVGIRLDF